MSAVQRHEKFNGRKFFGMVAAIQAFAMFITLAIAANVALKGDDASGILGLAVFYAAMTIGCLGLSAAGGRFQ